MTERPKFTEQDAERASEQWGCNCGPAALAAILNVTLEEVRPLMLGFESRGYTNPTLMFEALGRSGRSWNRATCCPLRWPQFGLARIQWEGPWTQRGVPIKARYRKTHWVGASTAGDRGTGVFDINCMHVGGWIALSAWEEHIVPWILREAVPRANGRWHLTHVIEVTQ